VVPGPGAVWSVDGYEKLAFVGIQIYACTDAYSRYIIWIYIGKSVCRQLAFGASICSNLHGHACFANKYIGISNRCAVSVLRQYLATCEETGVIPMIIRSDRGVEMPMMADAHHALRMDAAKLDASALPISQVYAYGKSTTNVRIES